MIRIYYSLKPQSRSSFSKNSSTQGQHESLSAPTGSSLLGWAASQAYSIFKDLHLSDAVFHSSKVRFSNAYPVTYKGIIGFPVPKILLSPKHVTKNIEKDASKQYYIGSKNFADAPDNENIQAAPLKNGFICEKQDDGKYFHFGYKQAGRLRTATEKGRAKEASLFGYTHNEPTHGSRFVFWIDIDDEIQENTPPLINGIFKDKTLFLGRASRNGYGGSFHCTPISCVKLPSPQKAAFDKEKTTFRVWALSDLALFDCFGNPTLEPSPELFGLTENDAPQLIRSECSVTSRRFAPWNAKLQKRDIERNVVEAGSVFTFEVEGHSIGSKRTVIGEHTNIGLGHVWINPPHLEGKSIQLITQKLSSKAKPKLPDAMNIANLKPKRSTNTNQDLGRWLSHSSPGLSSEEMRKELLENFKEHMKTSDETSGPNGPSKHQWSRVVDAAEQAKNTKDLINTLFKKENAICGKLNQPTQLKNWGAGSPSYRQQLENFLSKHLDEEIKDLYWTIATYSKKSSVSKNNSALPSEAPH